MSQNINKFSQKMNQEDSLIFSKSSIERGIFKSLAVRKYASIIRKSKSTSQVDVFVKPDPTKIANITDSLYDKINENGFTPEETVIDDNDVIIGKVLPQTIRKYNDDPENEQEVCSNNESSDIFHIDDNIDMTICI
jgi:DNA-directed RNA polymerase beta subunit